MFRIFADGGINHGNEFLQSHATKIKFERIPGAQQVQKFVELLTRALRGRCASSLKADALGCKHLPEWHHAGISRYFEQGAAPVRTVYVICKLPGISVGHGGPIIQPVVALQTAFKD